MMGKLTRGKEPCMNLSIPSLLLSSWWKSLEGKATTLNFPSPPYLSCSSINCSYVALVLPHSEATFTKRLTFPLY